MRSGIPGDFRAKKNKNNIKQPNLFLQKKIAEKRANNFCRKRMKAFLKNPGKQSWKEFNKAYNKLFLVNPSQANAIIVHVRREMFNRAIFEKDLQ